MNKITAIKITATVCFIIVFILAVCAAEKAKVRIPDVESEIYSQEEIAAAIKTIRKEFKKSYWKWCTLKEIYYAGDEVLPGFQDFAERNDADEVIVLLSSFYVGPFGGDGSLNTDYTYKNWNWILVRTDGGEWVHVDHGY